MIHGGVQDEGIRLCTNLNQKTEHGTAGQEYTGCLS